MAWFGAALLCLLGALALGLAGGVGPGDWSRGAGMAVVHLFTLGWLGLMLLGALVQFVPVLTARPAAWPGLALPALLSAVGGTLALAGGFLWLDGQATGGLFVAAPWLLALAFALVLAMIGPPMLDRAGLRLAEVRMVLLALIGLAGLWATGLAMVLDLTGNTAFGFLPDGLPLHVLFGIGGWMSLAAFGVSYKLFAMFLLAPDRGGRLRQGVLAAAAIAVLLVAGLALAGKAAPAALMATALVVTAALYLAEIARLWRLRRRPQPETNMAWSRVALMFLGLSALLAWPALGWGGIWAETAIWIALTGWLSLLTLAQMVKIVSFLTWMQVFAPRIGRGPVPLVQDLTDPRRVAHLLALWSAGVAGGAMALLLVQPLGFRLSLALLLLSALGLAAEVLAIRRLSHLAPAMHPATVPPLFLPAPQPGIRHDRSA